MVSSRITGLAEKSLASRCAAISGSPRKRTEIHGIAKCREVPAAAIAAVRGTKRYGMSGGITPA